MAEIARRKGTLSRRRRLGRVAAATGIAAAFLTPTMLSNPVGAAQGPIVTPTRLDVRAALGRQSATTLTIPRLQARLTTDAGRPLGNRTVRFSVLGRPACSARTNDNGVASCRAVLPVHATSGTYVARFAGDRRDRPASGIGLLLVVRTPAPPPSPTTTTVPNPTTTFPPPTSTSTTSPGQTSTTFPLPTSTAPTSSSLPQPSTTSTSTTVPEGTIPPITGTTTPGGSIPPTTSTTTPGGTIPPTTTTTAGGGTTIPNTTIPNTTVPNTTVPTTLPPTSTTFRATTTTSPVPAVPAAAVPSSPTDLTSRALGAEAGPQGEEEVTSLVVDRFNNVIAPLLAQIEASCEAAREEAPQALGFARAVAMILPDAAILSSTVVDSVARSLGRCP